MNAIDTCLVRAGLVFHFPELTSKISSTIYASFYPYTARICDYFDFLIIDASVEPQISIINSIVSSTAQVIEA